MIKGRAKLFVIAVFLIVTVSTLPVVALPLPYEGLDWLSYQDELNYGYTMSVRAYFPIILKDY